ncbi:MAG TPA: hypothetical protein VKG26_10420, partial [Bacteroidia bacterium]|nr:hypothetical protein [Bacteroidia bacterium]
AQINPASVIVDAVHNTAYFELSQTQIKIAGINSYVNPVCKAALNFGRIKTTREAFDVAGEPSGTLSPGAIIGAMLDASFLNTTLQTLQGPEDYLYNTRGLGHTIIPTKSWFRLYNPYGDKLGGGSRVKQIVMKDNWNTMVGNAQSGATNLTSYYGQSYDYTINQTINGTTLKVSSGVASYEPMAGGDENPFRMPLYSGNHPEAALAPDNRYYVEEPFGETLFPSATVGYSQVTTTNLVLDENGVPLSSLSTPLYVTKHGTGYVVNQFYTAKDYPLKTTRTDMNVKEAKSGLGGQILRLDLKHYMTASQGYVVEMNDMHGKAKATWVYAQGQSAPLSGKQYFYRDNYVVSNGVRTPGNQLLNENVPVVDGNGNYYSSGTNVGIDYDFITDFREEETVTETVGANINFYVFYVVVPLAIPPIWPMYSKESTRLRTAVTTKVINRYGILDQVVAYQNGSTVSTQNELWDGETGEVLLTKANNEYDDTTFSMTYPAHWAYQGMSPAYINDLLTYTYTGTALTGSIQSDLNTYFAPGDVVIITGTSSGHTTPSQAVVSQIGTNNVIIDYYNSSIPSLATYGVGTTIKVIRPGRRNMQSLPIGTITSLNNPVPYTTTQGSSVFSILSGLTSSLKIISASATEYSDIAKLDCGCLSSLYPSYVNSYGIINPYLVGLRGCWHPKTVYSFLTNRSEV